MALISTLIGGVPADGKMQDAPFRVRVAVISYVPAKIDLAANAARLEWEFRRAAAGGARLAVAPEGALDGYAVNEVLERGVPAERMRESAIGLDDPVMRRFQQLAAELDLCIAFGIAERSGGDVHNTAVFIDNQGQIRGTHRKMMFAEGNHPSWWFNRMGEKVRAFETPFGRCGILICHDRWQASLASILALDGVQLLLIPAFGSVNQNQDQAVLDRARELRVPVLEANVGVSLVISEGAVVATVLDSETLLFSEVTIPPARMPDVAGRDRAEKNFVEWRNAEMSRRFEERKSRYAPEYRGSR